MALLQSIQDGYFSIVVEFTPHSRSEVEHIAGIAKGLPELNKKYADQKIRFAGISLTQNPGGNLSYDHLAAIGILKEHGFPDDLEICPHVTGKDMNVDAIRALLIALSEAGVQHVLALTGDLSDRSLAVFEVDSLGLLQLVNDVNLEILRRSRDLESFRAANLLEAGAAVSPFKYSEGSLAMQMIKARKKIQMGAAFLTCQSGWDAQRSEFLMEQLGELETPLIGNVLVVNFAAAKYMQELAGCVVTDDFLNHLATQTPQDNLELGGRQLAMFRDLGYAGVDLGRPGEFKSIDEIEKVVDTALATSDWREFREIMTFAPEEQKAPPRVSASASISKTFHNAVFEESGPLHGVATAVLSPFEKSYEKEGALYKLFNCLEGFGKGLLYECEHCGDCFLPENDFVCTRGQCEKGLSNPPCGDAQPDGRCGNNPNRFCAAETLYYRLMHHNDLEDFKKKVVPYRRGALQDSSSILNYFFKRDHAGRVNPLAGSGLIQIAELIHASIPLPGAAMQYVQQLGEKGFQTPNRGRAMVEFLVESQAREGADYIDINIDALAEPDAPALMRRFVRLVHEKGRGVPPCIDSSDMEVLKAGLDEWFSLDAKRAPLVNSIPYMELEKYLELFGLRKQKPFSIICLLVGQEGPLGSTDAMVDAAREMHGKAREAGFANEEIFFDTVTLGIASDGCMDAMGNLKASHTHNSFHAIKRIREDESMRGVHAVLGVSNWVYGATKRRIGHIRAFISVAQKFGLDAVIVDVAKEFGIKPVAPELEEFVQMYVDLDGSEDSMMAYSAMMQRARSSNWI
ncbi:MAG: methylenetetrahydrofolate reductase C-terminal domain-containing protein [Candidatus Sumerlaeia bacterium]